MKIKNIVKIKLLCYNKRHSRGIFMNLEIKNINLFTRVNNVEGFDEKELKVLSMKNGKLEQLYKFRGNFKKVWLDEHTLAIAEVALSNTVYQPKGENRQSLTILMDQEDKIVSKHFPIPAGSTIIANEELKKAKKLLIPSYNTDSLQYFVFSYKDGKKISELFTILKTNENSWDICIQKEFNGYMLSFYGTLLFDGTLADSILVCPFLNDSIFFVDLANVSKMLKEKESKIIARLNEKISNVREFGMDDGIENKPRVRSNNNL